MRYLPPADDQGLARNATSFLTQGQTSSPRRCFHHCRLRRFGAGLPLDHQSLYLRRPGIDGLTWQTYATDLEQNLIDLRARVHRGAYRARPSRRTYIPKADGRQRPLAVAALEDKIVQRATVAVLNCIYEEEFLGFSYGFRPKRGQHDALDA